MKFYAQKTSFYVKKHVILCTKHIILFVNDSHTDRLGGTLCVEPKQCTKHANLCTKHVISCTKHINSCVKASHTDRQEATLCQEPKQRTERIILYYNQYCYMSKYSGFRIEGILIII